MDDQCGVRRHIPPTAPVDRTFLSELHARFGAAAGDCLVERGERIRGLRAGRPHGTEDRPQTDRLPLRRAPGGLTWYPSLQSPGSPSLVDLEHGIATAGYRSLIDRRADRAYVDTIVVRPRDWAQEESQPDGTPVAAALWDIALIFNRCSRHTFPALLLPVFSGREAALWQAALTWCESMVDVPPGTVRVAVAAHSILTVLELDAILAQVGERCDVLLVQQAAYVASLLSVRGHDPSAVLPDRLSRAVPFLRAYSELLNRAAARWGIDLIDPDDSSGVCLSDAASESPALDPLDLQVYRVRVAEDGLRHRVRIALKFVARWLGADDDAGGTPPDPHAARLAWAQLWQWSVHRVRLADEGPAITPALLHLLVQEEAPHVISRPDTLRTAVNHVMSLIENANVVEHPALLS